MILDCGQNNGKNPKFYFSLYFFQLHLFLLVEISRISSQTNFSLVTVDLNAINDAQYPVDLILNRAKRIVHFGIVLNFNCKLSKQILEIVL